MGKFYRPKKRNSPAIAEPSAPAASGRLQTPVVIPPIPATTPPSSTSPAAPPTPRNTAKLLAVAEKETRLAMASSGNGGRGGCATHHPTPPIMGISGIQLIAVAVQQSRSGQA